MEYADSGTLRNYLEKSFSNLTWDDKFNLALQLAYAVSCLHDEKIVHRDLVIRLYCILYLIIYLLYILYKRFIIYHAIYISHWVCDILCLFLCGIIIYH